MRKFIAQVLLFFGFVAVVDLAFGFCCERLEDGAKGGPPGAERTMLNLSDCDVLIGGSSRAVHHFVPTVFKDSLGMDCYNCGQEGHGIFLFYTRYKLLSKRHLPKIVVYEYTPQYDRNLTDPAKYLDILKRYAGFPVADSLIMKISPKEQYKLFSNMYRYNTYFVSLLASNVRSASYSKDGYLPLFGKMTEEPLPEEWGSLLELDSLKLEYLERLAADTKEQGVKLYFSLSPLYRSEWVEDLSFIESISKKYDVPFIDMHDFEPISGNRVFFNDPVHLNDEGARSFTMEFVNLINNQIECYAEEKI